MSNTEPKQTVAKLKRKRKKKSLLNYLLLFIFVFTLCVVIFLSGIKSYTPTADVEIGNEESVTMDETDLDFEIKSVDERLRWIQMEDELPTVAIRNSKADKELKRYTPDTTIKLEIEEEATEEKFPSAKKVIPTPVAPKPTMQEIVSTEKQDFRTAQVPKQIIPLPVQPQTYTKVYLGAFSSLEEAIAIQKKINTEFPNTAAFIKATNNYYIVQLGSFSDRLKANDFIVQLREKGYNPKTL